MSEPHQRTQSGKLRKTIKSPINEAESNSNRLFQNITIGIDSATSLDEIDYDDEISVYRQTPTSLCNYQVQVLSKFAQGFDIKAKDSIDTEWRRTWNIGCWHIGSTVSISINIIQPNIAGCWSNIVNTDISIVQNIAASYLSYGLPKSACSVEGNNSKVQIKGRWTPYVIDTLLKDKIITEDQISISNLNISQSKIFCWMLIGKKSKYMCRLTKNSLEVIVRYVPDWAIDINEVSAGGSISLKIKSTDNSNDATQLTINSSGSIQYQGKARYLQQLPNALSTAIRTMMMSIHIRPFLDSLEYKIVDK